MRSIRFILAMFVVLGSIFLLPELTLHAADAPTVTTNSQANLRSGPATTYSILATIPYKTTLPAVGRNDDKSWVQVNFNGTVGWLVVRLLKVTGDLSTLPVVAPPPVPPTPTKAPSKPNVRAGVEFATAAGGVLRVRAVSFADKFPNPCFSNCYTANAGYTLLILTLAPKGRLTYDDANTQIAKEWTQAQVVTADGFTTGPSVLFWGITNSVNKIQIVFGVPAGTHKFQLIWPGNAPIPLRG